MHLTINPYTFQLWIGTHPNNPSYLWSDPSKSLQGLIQSSPLTYLGPSLTAPFDSPLNPTAPPGPGPTPHSTHIPYLFKVLSIALALPLQTHPSKALAEKLHKEDPKQFVDSNHKPEIAIAIEDGFKGFVGFGEHNRVKQWLQEVQELREAVGNEEVVEAYLKEQTKAGMRRVLESLLTRDAGEVERCVVSLARKIEREGAKAVNGDEQIAEVVKLLYSQYGGDVGVLVAPFFMNFVMLDKGEAVSIPADTVHAYLEGGEYLVPSLAAASPLTIILVDIIECMATSDNVLNAGFVPPSSRQTRTFVDSLAYDALPASAFALPRTPYKKSRRGKTVAYDPPFEEFTVLGTKFSASEAESVGQGELPVHEVLESVLGPTACIVTKGMVRLREEGKVELLELGEGGVGFVKPGVVVEVLGEGQGPVEIWWAMWDQN